MDFRILGPLEVWDGERQVELGGPKRRAVLAFLLFHANEVVAIDRLVDQLWGEKAPRNAAGALHTHVSRLRKELGPEIVATRAWGYVLRTEPDSLDLERFERLSAEAENLPARERAVKLGEALALWRGPPLEDLAFEPALAPEIARLEELRLTVLENRIDADLEAGNNAGLVAELEALIAEHPLRERLRGQLILALYRSGRQAEALEVYRETRRVLAEELGLEPSPELRELERAILQHDPALRASPVSTAVVTELGVRPGRRRRLYIGASLALLIAGLGVAVAVATRPTHAAAQRRTTSITADNPTSVTPYERNVRQLAWKSLEPAPRKVLHWFATLERDAPAGPQPQAVAREARKVPLPDGGTVYVAPATNGGFCEEFRGSGGCDPARSFTINPSVAARGGCGLPQVPTLLTGHVNAKYRSTLDLEVSDGSLFQIGLTWVGPPIDAGFFEEVPPAAKHIKALLLRLPSGKILATDKDVSLGLYKVFHCSFGVGITRPPGGAQLRHKRRLLAQPTAAGLAAIWTAPDRVRPGTCAWLTVERVVYGGDCRRSRPPRRGLSEVVPLRLRVKGHVLNLLWGHVGADVAKLALRFRDGSVTRLPVTESVFFYVLPEDHGRLVHRPASLIAREKNGNRISEQLPWNY